MTEQEIRQIFPFLKQEEYKPYRLICFHHAGGSTMIFHNWLKWNPLLEVIPIEMAGRGTRITEECNTEFEHTVREMASAVAQIEDGRRLFFYGHSLGSILAFETANCLSETYGIKIGKLFVAGRAAPSDVSTEQYRPEMGLEALKQELLRIGATPEKILRDEDFCKMMLPMIYADYQLSENYCYQRKRVDYPIVAANGDGDPDADYEMMSRWKKVTEGEFRQYQFRGDHFFPYQEEENNVLNMIYSEIRRIE